MGWILESGGGRGLKRPEIARHSRKLRENFPAELTFG